MKISFADDNAFDEFTAWALVDKKIFKKIVSLIKDVRRNPTDGIGKPEPLKYELSGCWSRRITDEHRLVYYVTKHSKQRPKAPRLRIIPGMRRGLTATLAAPTSHTLRIMRNLLLPSLLQFACHGKPGQLTQTQHGGRSAYVRIDNWIKYRYI